MEIKLYDRDIKHIANNERQGGGSHTALEVCLARKVVELKKTISAMNDERTRFFDALYSIHEKCVKVAGEGIKKRRRNNLYSEGLNCFKKAVENHAELEKES